VRTLAEGIAFGSHVANNSSSRNRSNYEGFTIVVLNVDFECALSALSVTVNQPRPRVCLVPARLLVSGDNHQIAHQIGLHFVALSSGFADARGGEKYYGGLPFSRAIFVIGD
jgi:hypothetical protein